MPRKWRSDVPWALHHVIVRGIGGSNIFLDDEERKAFVDRIRSNFSFELSWLRPISGLRRRFCFYFYRELGMPMAEISRQVGVGTTGVAIREMDAKNN